MKGAIIYLELHDYYLGYSAGTEQEINDYAKSVAFRSEDPTIQKMWELDTDQMKSLDQAFAIQEFAAQLNKGQMTLDDLPEQIDAA